MGKFKKIEWQVQNSVHVSFGLSDIKFKKWFASFDNRIMRFLFSSVYSGYTQDISHLTVRY